MRKCELLSPVGNMESLYQAIHNGADAVYLGLKSFGARSYAKNFDEEEIIKAIKLCHLYGVKIYITMNTLIKDIEVEDFIKQVDFIHKNGVDAIIMQDFGMICLCRQMFPNLEIHASTQANNTNIETIKLFHDLGVKRVVLSRELSLDEIKKIDIPIELEVFIHGALCISYSGNCLMSSMMGSRSGNRGECTGSCRLPYTLYKNDEVLSKNKYLLSTREFNTTKRFSELLDSNITSFKIEGRMKSPYYVGFITRLYRNIIDGKQFDLDDEIDKLKTLYNRKFTEGNLFKTNELMNIDTPNHIGLKIGKVVDITKKKIKIKLDRELNQEDGIRFLESGKGFICNYLYDKKDNLINSSNDYVYIDNKIGLSSYDTVYKTSDKKLNSELEKINEKKIPINIKLIGRIGNKLELIMSDEINTIRVLSTNNLEKAISSPTTEEKIKTQLEKLGNTPFKMNNIVLDVDDNIFVSIKEINELRRTGVEELINKRENVKTNYIKNKVIFDKIEPIKENTSFTATVINEEQLLTCKELNFSRIYVKDIELYKKYKNDNRIFYKQKRNKYKELEKEERRLISEYGYINDSNIVGDYFLNVYNSYTAYYLLKNGLNNFCLSVELNNQELEFLIESFKRNFKSLFIPEILVYGRVENMYIKGNVLNINNDLYTYELKDQKNRIFPCYLDGNDTVILNFENKELDYLFNFNYKKRFDFYDEDRNTIKKIVKKYQ